MLRKKVKHEVGLAVVVGAFLFSWFGAAYPALQFTAEAPQALHATLVTIDSDRDGVPDNYDADPLNAR